MKFEFALTPFYVDFKTKCVFNGSDLGKEFSAKAILERFVYVEKQVQGQGLQASSKPLPEGSIEVSDSGSKNNLVDILFRPEFNENQIPYPFKKGTKKKKRNRISF